MTLEATGRRERLPDFIIGGAPRCGTTWLYRALDRHPYIWLAKPNAPEPKFFHVDEEYDQGLDYYRRKYFAAVPDDMTVGEKTVNYLASRPAAERVAKDVPNVKMIFLLREPSSRAYSNYRYTRMSGFEDLEFGEALNQESAREQEYEGTMRYARPYSYFAKGLYASHLENWFNLFPREQILVERYEDLVAPGSNVLGDIHRFVGVEPRPDDAKDVGIINPADQVKGDPCVLESLRQRYAEPNRRLYELLGVTLWSDEGDTIWSDE